MENFFQITENELVLPGVKGKHVFWHISDVHVACVDEISTEEEKAEMEKAEEIWYRQRVDFARNFGEPVYPSHMIPSAEVLHKLLAYAKENKPEKLLLSGDILDYLHPAGLRLLEKELRDYGDDYLFVPGNHEAGYREHPELKIFNHGGNGVNVYEGEGFKIAALDDHKKTVADDDLASVKALSEGETPVILLMHVPIATSENAEEMKRFGDYFAITASSEDENARELVKTLADPDSAVKAILAGHVHGYHVSTYSGTRRQIMASSGLVGFIHRFTIRGED